MKISHSNLIKKIIDYYSPLCDEYLSGDQRKTLAIHAGYTDGSVEGYSESLLYMNEIISNLAKIKSNQVVLDAGCGVGGSSIWLAKNRKVKVYGISLVQRQVVFANKFAKEEEVSERTFFSVGDFTCSGFPSNVFDIVWALESACYAVDKSEFLQEAYRLLKPGGTLVVADGFRLMKNLTTDQELLLKSWLDSWVVPNLEVVHEFEVLLNLIGYTRISFIDITKNVLPFSVRLYMTAVQSIAEQKGVASIKELQQEDFSLVCGARDQMRSLVGGIWIYGVFVAEKP